MYFTFIVHFLLENMDFLGQPNLFKLEQMLWTKQYRLSSIVVELVFTFLMAMK